ALTPGIAVAALPPGILDLWITPPAYTGLPPMLPRTEPGQAAAAISVPAGSALLAQVSGGRGVPRLLIDGEATNFSAIDPRTHRVAAKIEHGSRLVVDQDGKPLGAWPMTIVPDMPPTVEFAQPPKKTVRAALQLEYHATDDYGLAGVTAHIRRQN